MSKVNQVAKENKDHHDHFKVNGTNSGVFNVEDITNSIVDQAKSEVKSKYGNKKRHRQ